MAPFRLLGWLLCGLVVPACSLLLDTGNLTGAATVSGGDGGDAALGAAGIGGASMVEPSDGGGGAGDAAGVGAAGAGGQGGAAGGEAPMPQSCVVYRDGDSDDFGDPAAALFSPECEAPVGYVYNDRDCDDSAANVNPNQVDTMCDGKDTSCSGWDNCPPKCIAFKAVGNDYKLCSDTRSNADAARSCAALGYKLAGINTLSENTTITSRIATNMPTPFVWIDGSDATKEGLWRFSDGVQVFRDASLEDGTAVWADGEPNNGAGNVPENCVVIRDDARWDDRSCAAAFPYLCEL